MSWTAPSQDTSVVESGTNGLDGSEEPTWYAMAGEPAHDARN
jgi:hypothetical protein